jgi:hypothetical protein
MKSVLREWRAWAGSWTIRAPRADAGYSLVLVSPSNSLAWGLWPEPRTVAMSTSYSIACNAKLPRAAIVIDLD